MKKRLNRICVCAVFMCVAVCTVAQDTATAEKTAMPSSGETQNPIAQSAQQDIYGAYWGEMTMFFSAHKTCVTLAENEVMLYSTKKVRSYSRVTYTDNGDGTWLVCAYSNQKTPGKHKPNVTVLVDTRVAPYSAQVTIVAMNKNIHCVKGKNYDFSLEKQE